MASMTASSSSPTKMEMMAGGASLAPRRWSLPGVATEVRSRSAYSSTALMTAARKTRNCRFSMGVSPGSSRFSWVVDMDQLLCLPLPLTPSKGFSCCRQTRPYLGASFFIISIVSRLWSMATLVVSKMGASSCWQGATSLCLVLAGTPSFHSSSSSSFMNAETSGRMTPK